MNNEPEKPTGVKTDHDAWEQLSKHPEDRATPLFWVGVLISVAVATAIVVYFYKHGGIQI